MKFPQLYSQTKDVFNYKMFTIWIVIAIIHSISLFWICLFVMKNEVIWMDGKIGDYSVFGNILYSVIGTFKQIKGTNKLIFILFV